MEGIANVLESAMDRVRALIQHVVPLVPSEPRAPTRSGTDDSVEGEAIMIRDVLRMGDPRLLERSRDVADFDCAGDSRRCSRTCATRCARRTARASPRRRSASACAS